MCLQSISHKLDSKIRYYISQYMPDGLAFAVGRWLLILFVYLFDFEIQSVFLCRNEFLLGLRAHLFRVVDIFSALKNIMCRKVSRVVFDSLFVKCHAKCCFLNTLF